VGVEQRIATHPLVAILETGAVIDPAVDRTASSADLLLLGGVHEQWRPGRRSQPRIHLPRGLMAESGRALLVARSRARCDSLIGEAMPTLPTVFDRDRSGQRHASRVPRLGVGRMIVNRLP
jgi:hypothetical protein